MSEPIYIVYDGDCPFCSAYVRMLRLRDAIGEVVLLDARQPHAVVDELRRSGVDFDEGMAVSVGGRVFHGAEAIHWLSVMTTPSRTINGLFAWVMRSKTCARIAYPILRAGRNLALFLKRKGRIGSARP